MEWIDIHEKDLRIQINKWFLAPEKDTINTGKSGLWKPPVQQLNYLTNLFLNFSSNSFDAELKSETLLFKKIFNTSRHQIRSFLYVPTLKKLRSSLQRINTLQINEKFSSIAISACSNEKLISQNTLHSYEWRLLALYQLLLEIERNAENLVELLTEEMTSSLFLHYPVAYTAISSSIASICKNYRKETFQLFAILRTMEKTKFLPFPKSEKEDVFPPMPWDDSMLVKLQMEGADEAPAIPQQPKLKKLDLKISVKPTGNLKPRIDNKPKKASLFDNLGF